MRNQLLALYQLQEIDSRVLEIERSAADFPSQIRELEKGLEEQRSLLGALRSEVDQKRGQQRESETQIKDEGAKHQKWKRRLNDIKTPREYQALSREVEQGERLVRDLEDQVLQLGDDIEKQQKVIDEREAELKARETEVFSKVRELREKEAKIKAEANAIKRGRDSIVQKLPPGLVQKYERVRERRGGIGVAVMSGSSCGGCNVELRPQLAVEIRKLNSIEQCPMCNRILVLESLVADERAKNQAAKT